MLQHDLNFKSLTTSDSTQLSAHHLQGVWEGLRSWGQAAQQATYSVNTLARRSGAKALLCAPASQQGTCSAKKHSCKATPGPATKCAPLLAHKPCHDAAKDAKICLLALTRPEAIACPWLSNAAGHGFLDTIKEAMSSWMRQPGQQLQKPLAGNLKNM